MVVEAASQRVTGLGGVLVAPWCVGGKVETTGGVFEVRGWAGAASWGRWSNLISHAAVLGWLYWAAPSRLCTRYLMDQQAALGAALVAVAMALLLGLAWYAMRGTAADAGLPAGPAARLDGGE